MTLTVLTRRRRGLRRGAVWASVAFIALLLWPVAHRWSTYGTNVGARSSAQLPIPSVAQSRRNRPFFYPENRRLPAVTEWQLRPPRHSGPSLPTSFSQCLTYRVSAIVPDQCSLSQLAVTGAIHEVHRPTQLGFVAARRSFFDSPCNSLHFHRAIGGHTLGLFLPSALSDHRIRSGSGDRYIHCGGHER